MKKIYLLICMMLCMTLFSGCEEVSAQVETIAQQIDVEAIVTGVVESIDWQELKAYAQDGYTAMTDKYPALKSENIKTFLKTNGLDLMNRYIENSDAGTQETAKKLGAILKILNPELTDEVDSIIAE